MTAVSTGGFSPGAKTFAKEEGIELREVKDLSPEEFSRWFVASTIPFRHPQGRLLGAMVIVAPEETPAVTESFKDKPVTEKIFRSIESGEIVSTLEVFESQLNIGEMGKRMQDMKPGDGVIKAKLTFQFPSDSSHYVLDIAGRAVRVREFIFACELFVTEILIPIAKAAEYSSVESGKPISQMVAYEFPAFGKKLSLEMHNISESGQTQVVLRVLGDN